MQDKAYHYFVDLEGDGVGGFNNIEGDGSKGSQCLLGTFKILTRKHQAWQVTPPPSIIQFLALQGKSCWIVETIAWTYDWLQKVKHDDFKTFFNNFRTKGDLEKGAYQRSKCKKQEKIANKGKMVLDKINEEVAKWERLLDKKIFFLMKPSQWSIL